MASDRNRESDRTAKRSGSRMTERKSGKPGDFKRKDRGRHDVSLKNVDPDRMAAYEALVRIERSKAYSNIELNAVTGKGVRNPGFVRELVYGIVRNKGLLDYYIDSLVDNGIRSVKTELKILLRMGIYQIAYMNSVPEHSAVDETVKMAKAMFRGRSGFVNGVLRNFIRGKAADPRTIRDAVKRIHIQYSCDTGLVKMLISQYGEEKTEEFLRISLETPPLYIRVNTLKISALEIADKLEKQGFTVNDNKCNVNYADSLIVSGKGVLETESFRNGEFFVQDASSSEAVEKLAPEAKETLIDVCAAPGGKTFTAAIFMENAGVIHAMDLHENKLRALNKQAARLGIGIIQTEPHDAKEVQGNYIGTADKVLCDVPCSGLGVLRRKPEIKNRPLAEDGRDLAEIQLMILSSSSEYVKPGGKLMYSTCTINRIENEEVVAGFLEEHGSSEKNGFTLVESKLMMPVSGGSDGFFYAVMQRNRN